MARYKTFDSTGIATAGRLYAGDLNAIQDFLAKQADFTQTVDLGTLRIGDSSIQLVKFGTAEARVSAALRTDGILRGLGGVAAGSFTTTARDAIPLGFRPTGLVIFNTTTNRNEVNIGTDAAPSWAGTGDPVPGVMWPWPYSEVGIPGGWAITFGQSVTKAANPILWARANADGFPHGGDASNVTLPDMRGRVVVGKDNMGGAAANRVGVGNNGQTLGGSQGQQDHQLLMAQMPAHSHNVDNATPTGGVTGAQSAFHTHPIPNMVIAGSGTNVGTTGSTTYNASSGTGATSTESPSHVHAVSVNGSGNFHNNMQPGMIMNWIIKLG